VDLLLIVIDPIFELFFGSLTHFRNYILVDVSATRSRHLRKVTFPKRSGETRNLVQKVTSSTIFSYACKGNPSDTPPR